MNSFNLLGRKIQEYIFDQGWPALTKIQEASIKYVHETDANLILAAPTASGKTEAAFLPAINSISNWDNGVKILYISPLIALINDQFDRISKLCQYLDINVTSWHGESSQAKKNKLRKNPNGIVLITPESIEAMLSLRSGEASSLFSGVEWIIVDEIHGFLSSNRGIQLASLIERLQKYMPLQPRCLGMSATLHKEDYSIAKSFFQNNRPTSVIVDNSKNKLLVSRNFFPKNLENKVDEAVEAIYTFSQEESMLVFPNSRSDVEYLAVALSKKSLKLGSHVQYFSHHSSLSKELRLTAEKFAKRTTYELFTICCTSTLEMGIDIGSVDSIVQFNAPYSVSSLGQRLGRSGRKSKKSILHFIATDPWNLLQGLAAISIYESGSIDNIESVSKPYDVFSHQLLSILLEKSGLFENEYYELNKTYSIWNKIDDSDFKLITNHLLETSYIEKFDEQLIAGIETEKLLRGPSFFTHFFSNSDFSVYSDSTKIGEIPFTISLKIDVNIFLGAKIWKIIQLDMIGRKIYVSKAVDGRPPIFVSGSININHQIRLEMFEILKSPDRLQTFSKDINTALDIILYQSLDFKKPFIVTTEKAYALRTFAGTRINQTILILFNIMSEESHKFILDDARTQISSNDPNVDYKNLIQDVLNSDFSQEIISEYLSNNPILVNSFMNRIKYQFLLPETIKIKYIVNNLLSLQEALTHLDYLYNNI